jgi:hypothetical protein
MSLLSRGVEAVDGVEDTERVRGVNASSCMLSKETIDFGLLDLIVTEEGNSLRLNG